MIAIPKAISMEFVRSLTPTDVREILENASDSIIDQVIAFLKVVDNLTVVRYNKPNDC